MLNKSKTEPLGVGFLPQAANLVDSFKPIIAGIILILSAIIANTTAVLMLLLTP